MKWLVAGLGLTMLACGANADEPSEQATLLALKIQDEGISVDEDLADEIHAALTRAATVTPVEIDCILVTADFEFDRVSISGVAEPVRSSWINGLTQNTGNEQLDALAELYEFTSVSYLSNFDRFSLTLGSPVRTDRLISELIELDVLGAGATIPIDGAPSNIELTILDDGWEFFYWIGWGDCLSGCINQHSWRTHVPRDPKAQPTLLEDSGDPIPHPIAEMCVRPLP